MRKYFIAGLLVWLPIVSTLVVLQFIIQMLDLSIAFLPEAYQPEAMFGIHIPGFGVVVSLLVLFLTGLLATNFFGRHFVDAWNRLINRIPMVRTLYSGFKQVCEAVFSPTAMAFSRVLLVQYPREGLWSIAFQTGEGVDEVSSCLQQQDMLTVFVPTTPNPTSGYLVLVKAEETIVLDMSVDQALKFVVSLGVIQPDDPLIENA